MDDGWYCKVHIGNHCKRHYETLNPNPNFYIQYIYISKNSNKNSLKAPTTKKKKKKKNSLKRKEMRVTKKTKNLLQHPPPTIFPPP